MKRIQAFKVTLIGVFCSLFGIKASSHEVATHDCPPPTLGQPLINKPINIPNNSGYTVSPSVLKLLQNFNNGGVALDEDFDDVYPEFWVELIPVEDEISSGFGEDAFAEFVGGDPGFAEVPGPDENSIQEKNMQSFMDALKNINIKNK